MGTEDNEREFISPETGLDQARERVAGVVPPIRRVMSMNEQPPEDAITEFINSLKKAATKTVKVVVKQRDIEGFEPYRLKTTQTIDVESFNFEELLIKIGKKFGKGDYLIQFYVPLSEKGGVPTTFTYQCNIDLSESKEEVPHPYLTTSDTSIKAIEQLRKEMSDFTSMITKTIEKQKEEIQLAEMERRLNARIDEMLNKIQSAQQPSPQAISAIDISKIINAITDTITKLQDTVKPAPPVLPPIQPQQPPNELIKSMAEIFKLGLTTGGQAISLATGSEEDEGESKSKGLMGVLENVGSKILEGVINRFSQPQQPQPQLEGPENPAVSYVNYALTNLLNYIKAGYQTQVCADWLRQSLTPQMINTLLTTPISNIIQAIPEFSNYQGQLSMIISLLRPKVRKPIVQPSETVEVKTETEPKTEKFEQKIQTEEITEVPRFQSRRRIPQS